MVPVEPKLLFNHPLRRALSISGDGLTKHDYATLTILTLEGWGQWAGTAISVYN